MPTPMMQQWHRFKREYPDAILFFRAGDFYEMFYEDAEIAARELGIALTSRGKDHGKDIPLAGIPYHALEPYLAKLVRKGYKVAICEQVEDPKKAKKVVKREVVRVVTPGTVIEDTLLEERSSNYLACIAKEKHKYSLALVELSTGEFLVTEFSSEEKLADELMLVKPAEILIPENLVHKIENLLGREKPAITPYREEAFIYEIALENFTQHFRTTPEAFGLSRICTIACGASLSYLKETQKSSLQHISSVRFYTREDFMIIDSITERNLELLRNLRDGTSKGTLLEVLDRCSTPMGARLLRKWILKPLRDVQKIQERLEAVEELIAEGNRIEDALENIKDLERISARISHGSASPRDLVALKTSLQSVPEIRGFLKNCKSRLLRKLGEEIPQLEDLFSLIDRALVENPPASVREGGIIKEGYDEELDKLREASTQGKKWIAELEERERRRTGISSLRVGYNSVFGYYIQVTKPNLKYIPKDYIRKQTLANAERFITPELKEKEALILNAEEKIKQREYELFQQIKQECLKKLEEIKRFALAVATLDLLLSLARVAEERGYTKPEVNDGDEIIIEEGRHPVVETYIDEFVPNSVRLNRKERLLIITGPNMAGKSTYLRQVALIVLMAQMGSFVPAEKAKIGVVDRIFTRVGASDDIASGRSTFMVEMQETANILNNATSRSLVILDEIGRGTSTFDGMSIAWAVAEHLALKIRCKALFATHYHHLAELENLIDGVKNYHMHVVEQGGEVIFLRKVKPGRADRSYGIHVAMLAGIPREVISRAAEVLKRLEEEEVADEKTLASRVRRKKLAKVLSDKAQRTLFDVPKRSPVVERLKNIDVNAITPLQALNTLAELVDMARREE